MCLFFIMEYFNVEFYVKIIYICYIIIILFNLFVFFKIG